jgi:hypothetical protein
MAFFSLAAIALNTPLQNSGAVLLYPDFSA